MEGGSVRSSPLDRLYAFEFALCKLPFILTGLYASWSTMHIVASQNINTLGLQSKRLLEEVDDVLLPSFVFGP